MSHCHSQVIGRREIKITLLNFKGRMEGRREGREGVSSRERGRNEERRKGQSNREMDGKGEMKS